MEWQANYALGIEEIDRQHQELLGHAASIIDAIQREKSWSDIHYEIVALRNFASFHFRFEEALMRLFRFPASENHATTHASFFARLAEIERQAIADNLHKDVVQLLTDWVRHHILCADRDYVDYLLKLPGIALDSNA